MFEDHIASFLQTFETILVKKFLVEFKVVSRIQMCWGISIRVEKKREKNENVAHEIVFQMAYASHPTNACTSSKKPFCLNRGKKQHFLDENTFFLLKNKRNI